MTDQTAQDDARQILDTLIGEYITVACNTARSATGTGTPEERAAQAAIDHVQHLSLAGHPHRLTPQILAAMNRAGLLRANTPTTADAAPYDAGDAPVATVRPLPIRDDAEHLRQQAREARAELKDVLHDLQIAVGPDYSTPSSAAVEACRRIATLTADVQQLTRATAALICDLDDARAALRTAAGSADRFRDVLADALGHHDNNPGDDTLITELRAHFGRTGPEPTRWRDALTGYRASVDQINAERAALGSAGPRAQELPTGEPDERGPQIGYEVVAHTLHRDKRGQLVTGTLAASAVSTRPTLAEAVEELLNAVRAVNGPAPRAQGPDDLTDRLAAALAEALRRHDGSGVAPGTLDGWRALLAEHADRSLAAGWTAEADRLDQAAGLRPVAADRRRHALAFNALSRVLAQQAEFVPLSVRERCAEAVLAALEADGRPHDDQCTAPVCAACGCWCHQAEG
ncbi:hypothetical protein [Micromonospora sp. NBRC 101691]|uniref:hypothetical protein n=1 Tax=Micromonospora sp. NBRC 101691 TaxID=3032198 RepID=UPI0024A1E223|nr:hypothetical protein [Micromonospora sp. NBRC 101691]GLY21674.1 hypothetical protein Misp04_14060 [Micromonospora sp. NBRC 101691]